MLLRHVIAHLRKQEWTAIAIDFLIVVVGVFIGIQVANWNETLGDRRVEHALLQRLHIETQELLAVTREEYRAHRERAAPSVTANPVLFSQQAARPLTVSECEWIAGSHVISRPTDELPVLDEMLATGQLNLIVDQEVKERLRAYILFRERQRGIYFDATNEPFRLYSRHPEQMTISRAPVEDDYDGRWTFLSGEGFRWVVNCNVDEMRRSASFLNDYVDNSGRNATVLQTYERREEQLVALEAVLAARLGVQAQPEMPTP
ncbi:MAG: hypothetical protein KF779_13160 [Hyphomonadaceae bacterium]|nr:hypothetical protein [Hyphomonadaceae bacterium]